MVAKKATDQSVGNEVELATGRDISVVPIIDWGDDAGAGLEDTDSDSYAIPFLRVIQKTSPQMDETSSEFIEAARAGMLYNTVTKRLYDGKTGVEILPVYFQRRFLRWAPRGSDQSFKGEYFPEKIDQMIVANEIKELDNRYYEPQGDGSIDPKKCDIFSDTRTHFVMVREEDGSLSQAVMALASTQIKKSKNLLSVLRGARIGGRLPPTWMNIIKLTTVPESNDQGSWHGVRFEAAGFVNDTNEYAAGKAFYDAVAGGEVAVNYEKSRDESEAEGDGF